MPGIKPRDLREFHERTLRQMLSETSSKREGYKDTTGRL